MKYANMIRLITRKNLIKCMHSFQQDGIEGLINKVVSKIRSPLMQTFLNEKNMVYANFLLKHDLLWESASDPSFFERHSKEENSLYQKILGWRQASKNQSILFINHSMGGGTQVYQDNLILKIKDEKTVYAFSMQSDGSTILVENVGLREHVYFNVESMESEEFIRLMDMLKISKIYVNQLISYPVYKVMSWIRATHIEYEFFIHDFYSICPSYNLLNSHQVYCYAETKVEVCRRCLSNSAISRYGTLNHIDIQVWRKNFKQFLLDADRVIAPSQSVVDIMQKYYPEIEVEIQGHKVVASIKKTFSKAFLQEPILHVAVVGAITISKGSQILYQLVGIITRDDLPIAIHLIGYTDKYRNPYRNATGSFEVLGIYDKNDLGTLLAKCKTGVVLIPSICPETYSYTTSEAMQAGYPVMCFDIGAPAERVRKAQGGWIIHEVSAKAIIKELLHLVKYQEKNLYK